MSDGRGGALRLLGAAALLGGCLGTAASLATPPRFTAVELLLVAPRAGESQSTLQTRYAAGVQRVVTELTRTRDVPGVRMVVDPDRPMVEVDATAGSAAVAVARAGDAAAAAGRQWQRRAGSAGPRLVRAVPAVDARRGAPSAPVDALVGAVLGGVAATVGAAARGGWPQRSGRTAGGAREEVG